MCNKIFYKSNNFVLLGTMNWYHPSTKKTKQEKTVSTERAMMAHHVPNTHAPCKCIRYQRSIKENRNERKYSPKCVMKIVERSSQAHC